MNQQTLLPNRNIRIALTDDHAVLRKGVGDILNSFDNCEVVMEAENGKELIDKLSRTKSFPDICFLDISMPVMNGYDTLNILKQKWPDIKVIILSMYNEEFSVVNMFKNGAKGYLLKNSNPKEYKKAILKVYNGGMHLSESLPKDWSVDYDLKSALLLPEREIQFLIKCGQNKTYAEIALEWNNSVRTVENLASRIGEKLNIHSRAGFALFAIRTGLVQ